MLNVAPVLNRSVSAPVKRNLLRKLRVPILAATIALGGAFINKAQAKGLEKDAFVPTAALVNDTIKPLSKGNVIVTDTVVVVENDTLSAIEDLTDDMIKISEHSLGISAANTASEELYTKILSNISESGDNPYSAIYLALSERQGTNSNAIGTSTQMDDIVENMKIFSRDNQDETREQMEKNGSITEFKYGENNSKTGLIFQNLNITGLNQKEDKDSTNDSVNDITKNFNGNISYRMKTMTENAEIETNINAGSENVDIQLAGMYKTKTANGGNLALSVNGRETMDGSTTNGSAGASLDYNKKDFYTGIYGYYNRETENSGASSKYTEIEGYMRYKQNINLHAGIQNLDYLKYYYSALNLSGIKDLKNINTKLSGTLSAEVGSYQLDLSNTDGGKINLTNLDFSLAGGAYFKTDDITASLNGKASYNYIIDSEGDNQSNIGVSALGAFSKGNIAVSAMFSFFKDIVNMQSNTDNPDMSNGVSIATCVGFEVKDLLKGISPQFSYTSTSINNEVQHHFNVTIKTSLEALKKSQK